MDDSLNDSFTNHTPLPQPTFYIADENPSFSTKRARHCRVTRLPTRPLAKTAPPGRIYQRRWTDQRPHFVSFKSNPENSFLDVLSSQYYDDRIRESYFHQAFVVESTLGQGSFGEVFKARKRSDGRLYAVKRAVQVFRNQHDRQIKKKEVEKHETLPPHHNLVHFYSAWEEKGRLYIQTELCERSLSQEIELRHDVPESTIWNYLIDLLMAVKHLHDFNLIHLDIKPDNVLISRDGICKLADFGLVFDLKHENLEDAREGDSKYLAPEILQYGQFNKSADIFSVGITMLEVASDLDLPTRGVEWQLLRTGLPDNLAASLSPDLRQVVGAMIHPDPALRPTARDLLESDTIRNKAFKRSIYITYRSMMNWTNDKLWWLWLFVYTVLSWLIGCGPRWVLHTLNKHKNSNSGCCAYGTCTYHHVPSHGNTPNVDERLARPLRYDISYSTDDDDGFEDDHQVRDLSPIRNISPDILNLSHNASHISQMQQSSPRDKSFDCCDQTLPPCNSTPAQSDFRPRRRLVPRSPPISSPLINKSRRSSSRMSSCILESSSPMLRCSPRVPISPGGDSILANRSLFRLALDAHGSSSEDEM